MSRTMSRSKFKALKARLGLERVTKPIARCEAQERAIASGVLPERTIAVRVGDNGPPLVPPQSARDPRREGEDARARGHKPKDNPYPIGSKERKSWDIGWCVEHQRLGGRRAA